MGLYKFSKKFEGQKVGKAEGHDWNASYKDLANVCAAVKGKPIAQVRKILDNAIEMKKAIPYVVHNKQVGHRSELGGKKGRYPKKECLLFSTLFESCVANAKQLGLDESKLAVLHAAAYKQNTLPRYRRQFVGGASIGYGKNATRADYETCRAEVMVGEKEFAKKEKAGKRNKKHKTGEKEGLSEKKSNEKPAQSVKPASEKSEKEKGESKTGETAKEKPAVETPEEKKVEQTEEKKQ